MKRSPLLLRHALVVDLFDSLCCHSFVCGFASVLSDAQESPAAASNASFSAIHGHPVLITLLAVSDEDFRLVSELDAKLAQEYSSMADRAHALSAHMKFLSDKGEKDKHPFSYSWQVAHIMHAHVHPLAFLLPLQALSCKSSSLVLISCMKTHSVWSDLLISSICTPCTSVRHLPTTNAHLIFLIISAH